MQLYAVKRIRAVIIFFMVIALSLGNRLYTLMQPTFQELKISNSLLQRQENTLLLPFNVLLDSNFRPLAQLRSVSYPLLQGSINPKEVCLRLGRAYYAEDWLQIGESWYWRSELSEREWKALRADPDLNLRPIYVANPTCYLAAHLSGLGGAGLNTGAQQRWQSYLENRIMHQVSSSLSQSRQDDYYVVTTIRYDVQEVVERIAGERIPKGGVLVLDNKGSILGAVSQPNPTAMPSASPYLNRLFASYPPGSLFKLLLAGMALDAGIISPQSLFYCPGFYQLPDRKLGCTAEHGWLDVTDAIAHSCNAAFAEIGSRLGYERLLKGINELSLGSAHGMPLLDIPAKASNYLPDDVVAGELANLSIGQGQLLATPLDMGLLYTAIANDGLMIQPQIVRGWLNTNNVFRANTEEKSTKRLWSTETNAILLQALRRTIEIGTGHYALSAELELAGKSGTAEIGDGTTNHAWFAALAPASAPEIVVIVFIEEGQWGGAMAGPIARDIMEEIFRIIVD